MTKTTLNSPHLQRQMLLAIHYYVCKNFTLWTTENRLLTAEFMDFSLYTKAQNDKNKPKARFACHTYKFCCIDLVLVILSEAKYPHKL